MSARAESLEPCEAVLGDFLDESGALCAVIFDRGGQRVAARGVAGNVDLIAIGALAAGAYASTEELARLIGEREFSVLFHQGEQDHLLVTLIDEGHLLLVVFDDHTTVGLVRMCAKSSATFLASKGTLKFLGGGLRPPSGTSPQESIAPAPPALERAKS